MVGQSCNKYLVLARCSSHLVLLIFCIGKYLNLWIKRSANNIHCYRVDHFTKSWVAVAWFSNHWFGCYCFNGQFAKFHSVKVERIKWEKLIPNEKLVLDPIPFLPRVTLFVYTLTKCEIIFWKSSAFSTFIPSYHIFTKFHNKTILSSSKCNSFFFHTISCTINPYHDLYQWTQRVF